MTAEVVRCRGLGVRVEIGRSSAAHERHLRDAARDQAGLAQRADAHRDVHPVGNQIDDLVVETNIKLDCRVAVRELRQCRQQEMAPERDRHINPQFALRLGARLVQTLLGVAQLIEDASAASQEIRAFRDVVFPRLRAEGYL